MKILNLFVTTIIMISIFVPYSSATQVPMNISSSVNFSNISTESLSSILVDSGTSFYWKFDSLNSTGIMEDYSPNYHNLTSIIGATQVGTSLFGRALQFNGDDYANTTPLWSSSPSQLMIETWVLFNNLSTSDLQTIFYQGDNGEFGLIYYPSSKQVCFQVKLNSNMGDGIWKGTSFIIPEENIWYHIMGTWSKNEQCIRIFLNGELKNQSDNIGDYFLKDMGSNYITRIGAIGYLNPTYNFIGIIDEIKVDISRTSSNSIRGNTVGFWNFNEGTSNHVRDRSAFGNDGTVIGANWINSKGGLGQALNFDGSSNYINIPSTNFTSITNKISIAVWVQPNDVSVAWNAIVLKGSNSDWNYHLQLVYNRVRWSTCTYPSQHVDVNSNTILTVGNWYYIVATYENNEMKLYINGILENSSVQTGNLRSSSSPLGIGAFIDGQSSSRFFHGIIDEVRITNNIINIGIDNFSLPFSTPYSNNDKSIYNISLTPTSTSYSDYGRFGSCYYFYGYSFLTYNNPSEILRPNITSIEAWIKPDNDYNTLQTIIQCVNGYALYLTYNNASSYNLSFEIGYKSGGDGFTSIIFSSPGAIQAGIWTHIMGTFDGKYQRLFINGVCINRYTLPTDENYLKYATNIASWNNFRIGASKNSTANNFYKGFIDEVRISTTVRDLTEDSDGDGMSDLYEIIRSVDSNQFNPLIHNGRYALLVAPVGNENDTYWTNHQIQFKYDITEMNYYLMSNGWLNFDIIFLTCSQNRFNLTIGDMFNGNWIDGEAFHNNIDGDPTQSTAIDAIVNGGNYSLQQSDGTWKNYFFSKISNNDILLIELRDHGSNDESMRYFDTYSYGNYNFSSLNRTNCWSASDFNTQLNSINCQKMIIILDMCYSGGYMNYIDSNSNRIILASQSDRESWRFSFLYYGRIKGELRTYYSDGYNGGILLPEEANNETINADGISGVDANRERINDSFLINKIISVNEAYYFADVVINDKDGGDQTPQYRHFTSNQDYL